MNEKKFCFIMCTNHAVYEEECLHYIHKLTIPDGYTVETISIKGASSMTSGYNQAMAKTDAKYKVYLHQDVFIINTKFLFDVLELFKQPSVGMIGMVGNLEFHKYAVMWKGKRVGMLHSNSIFFADSYLFGAVAGNSVEVDAIDGLMMITQYDLPWREDIFNKWDFYDASQSMEFRLKGYQVIVPKTEKPWCIHDDGILNMKNYFDERIKYIKEYIG